MSVRPLYHYTALHHAEEIVRSGSISHGGVPIPDATGKYLERVANGWQWLTSSSDWDQPWAMRKLVRCDRTEVRFVVDIPILERHRLLRWDTVAPDFGFKPAYARAFADLAGGDSSSWSIFSGGDSSSWFVFSGAIPKAWLKQVEKRPGLGADVPACEAWR